MLERVIKMFINSSSPKFDLSFKKMVCSFPHDNPISF